MPPCVQMVSTGLLVVSNLKNIFKVLNSCRDHVSSVLYVDLHCLPRKSLPQWNRTIADIYLHTFKTHPNLDVRVLVASLRSIEKPRNLSTNVDVLLLDQHAPHVIEPVQKLYKVSSSPIYLSKNGENFEGPDYSLENDSNIDENLNKVYDNVVLGGTFDRMHIGHKILLNEAVLRARKRVVVGVTAPNMLKSKKLHELVTPLETRIEKVREFLQDIDNTLQYEVVAIEDFMGPTRTDPNMDMIVVSDETHRSGQKINEIRLANGLKALDVYSIPLYESEHADDCMEKKVSSSNYRMDILGVRIHEPGPRPHLAQRPYIIGLTGGIASGKSIMAKRFERRGAKIINCDLIAHQVYEPNTNCYKKLVEHFGADIVGEDRKINRPKLGQIVFADRTKLEQLNEIVWPAVLDEVNKLIVQYGKEDVPVVIVEAALLLTAGWDAQCHEVWSMIIPPEEAIKRIVTRNKLTEEEARKRVEAQNDNLFMVSKSNVVFSSLWSEEFSDKQANRAWQLLCRELKF